MNRKLLTTSGLLMAVALFLAVNIASNVGLKSARLDLTEGRLYTLSSGSKNILKQITEPMTLRFYFSQKLANSLPGISSYAIRVRELLEEYQRIAGNNLKLQVIDPEPFSEEEDRAVAYGLQGVPIDDSNNTFYFGLAGSNSTDDEETITFFQPNREEFLEYDLTQLVYRLAHPKQKIVGIMSSLPMQGNSSPLATQTRSQPWMMVEQIRQLSQVRTLETNVDKIPEDINVLMIVHPKNFSDSTLYAIDQFVLHGGKAMVFVDPYSEADNPPSDPNNPLAGMNAPRHSTLGSLFEAWGVELLQGKVVGDLQTAQKVQVRKQSRSAVVNYPVWMDLSTKEYFNKEDIVTNNLGNVVLATAGSLTKKGEVGTTFVPLIESSDKSAEIETTKLGMFSDPEELSRSIKPAGKKFTLAARITGKVKTAFPNGKPKPQEDKNSEPTRVEPPPTEEQSLTESAEPINVIVVADTDLLEDQRWVQVQNFLGQRIAIPQAANATFVTNALDNLSGSNDLISVRSRGGFARPFTRVEVIQQQAEQQFREKEKQLQAQLQETDRKIRELQNKKQEGNKLVLSAEQQQEIANFRNEKIKIRKELRNVQHELQKNIENLESWMKFINIGLMPLLVGIGGITLSLYGQRRRRGLSPVRKNS
ncbi:MAG: hypothetical protein BWK79_05375 [Beggiatoa sp. IS2]|nr:MAG: hypothetical protein BWK79_05375 [Beggiatoa sp. IS2]